MKKIQLSEAIIPMHLCTDCLSFLIKKYGEVKCIARKDFSNQSYRLHDFIFFGAAKANKSQIATDVLINHKLPEDALVLIRTIYEVCLTIEYLIQFPEDIQIFIDHKIALAFNLTTYAKNNKGKPMWDKIVSPYSNDFVSHSISAYQLAVSSRYPEDAELYRYLYKYLSEHVHLNFASSGNYRNSVENFYTVEDHSILFQPIFWNTVFGFFLLDSIIPKITNPALSQSDFDNCSDTMNYIKEKIIEMLNPSEPDEYLNFDKSILKCRIEKTWSIK